MQPMLVAPRVSQHSYDAQFFEGVYGFSDRLPAERHLARNV